MSKRKIDIFICAGLVALVWSVFGQTLGHDFVNYDDRVYVTQNPQVSSGLTSAGIVWAFTHSHAGNWHPLTTISHMIDCELFGLRAGPHHAVNVALHTIAVLLLFAFLRLTTGATWRSAFVSAIFAIHPLRVESVAWVAERKDVLSAVFFMLTVIAYARYAGTPSLGRYLAMSIFCACGFMSKPMLVTLPLFLLVLDWWPLARRASPKLLFEKLPLFAMAMAVGIITFVLQRQAPGSVAPLPFLWRIENALVSYVVYIGQMFSPNDLVVFYPRANGDLPPWQVVGAAALLVAITVVAFRFRLTKPYLLAGWAWYLIMLLAVIGIVGFGLQAHADRYTYLPQIGLYVAIAWLVVDFVREQRQLLAVVRAAAVGIVVCLTVLAFRQTRFWRDSETLWSHALAVSPQNDVAHANYGLVAVEAGRTDDGLRHLQTALNICGSSRAPQHKITLALIYTNLALAFAQRGELDDAIDHLRAAVEFQPDYPDAHYNLAVMLAQRGEVDGAIAEFGRVIALRPDDAEARTSLATALAQKHRLRDAIAQYDAALKVAPRSAIAANNLAWILAVTADDSLRNPARSVTLAQAALASVRGNAIFTRTLAAAYAASGRFEEARATAEAARQIARGNDDVDLARQIEADLDLYARDQALRDSRLTNED